MSVHNNVHVEIGFIIIYFQKRTFFDRIFFLFSIDKLFQFLRYCHNLCTEKQLKQKLKNDSPKKRY